MQFTQPVFFLFILLFFLGWRDPACAQYPAVLCLTCLISKLIAGPIECCKDLLPQLAADLTPPSEKQRWEGTRLIVYGYFANVVIADNLAPFVDSAINTLMVQQNSLYWWVVITAFAFQLYCDFGDNPRQFPLRQPKNRPSRKPILQVE